MKYVIYFFRKRKSNKILGFESNKILLKEEWFKWQKKASNLPLKQSVIQCVL